jgi:hypothetical protein
MAKGTRFSSDSEVYKHTQQSALYAHKGAGIFYPKGKFTVESAGVSDAGKPIVLNGSGKLDDSLYGNPLIIAGANPGLWLQHDTLGESNSGKIDFTEDSNAFGVTNGYGFRIKMDGSANEFIIQSGNQTTVNNRMKVYRDTGVVRFEFPGDTEVRIASVGGSNDDSIVSFYEGVTFRGDIRWAGDDNQFEWNTEGFNIKVFPDVTTGENPYWYIYGYITAEAGARYGYLRIQDTDDYFEIGAENNANLLGIKIYLPNASQQLWIDGQITIEEGGLDSTTDEVIYFAGKGYPTTYRHKIETSHSSTPSNNKWFLSICDGGGTTFNNVFQAYYNSIYLLQEDIATAVYVGGSGASGDASLYLRGGSTSHRFRAFTDGDLYVYTDNQVHWQFSDASGGDYFRFTDSGTSALFIVYSNGKFLLPGIASNDAGDYDLRYDATDGVVYDTSDIRQKSNIRDLDYGLAEVLNMKPRLYDYHGGKIKDGKLNIDEVGKLSMGLVAQELYEVAPLLVSKPNNELNNFWGVRQNRIITVLIKAIQELNTKIEALEKLK